ncbi:thymidylate synthase [Vibrio parahaemolyticus]
MVFDSVQSALINVTQRLLSNEALITNPRGMKTREIIGLSLEISNPRNRLIYRGKSKPWSLSFAMAEFLWYMRGENSLATMAHYAPSLSQYSDDNVTLNSAYGYRIFGHHNSVGYDQWDHVKAVLKNDSASRQAIIHIRTPNDSKIISKDHPCTLALQFLVRDNKLYMVTTMRSNDVMIGSMYDIFAFTMMQELMAFELGLQLGSYHHQVGSWHLYEKDLHIAEEFIKCSNKKLIAMDSMTEGVYELIEIEEKLRNHQPIEARELSKYWHDWYVELYNYNSYSNQLSFVNEYYHQSSKELS